MRRPANPYHPDIPLFLLIIPLISAFNYYLTYTNIQFNGFLLLTFSIDTVQGYLAWWAVRSWIVYLDKKWPYEQGLSRRIAIQLASTLLIGLLIISLSTELVSWIARGRPAPLHFYTIDLFIISIWFFVINGIYIGLHFHSQWKASQATTRKNNDGLVVTHGKTDLRLGFDELAGFYVDDQYVVVCHMDGKKYYLDGSLDKIEENLPDHQFFRLNRQFIIHHRLISGFKRAENGKLQVLLKPNEHIPSEITVSRLKAPAFRRWFQPEG